MRIFILTISALVFNLTIGLFAQSDHLYHEGLLYVRLSDSFKSPKSIDAPMEVLDFFSQFKSQFGVQKVYSSFFLADGDLSNTFKVKFEREDLVHEFIKMLEKQAEVVYAEQIPVAKFHDFPNDLGPNTSGNNGQYYLYRIQAPQAWDILNQGDPNVVVAVIDDACQTNHPEIEGFTSGAFNAVDFSNNVEPTNNNWDHGTFIAGLITARTNNNEGMASLGRGLRVLPIRVTGPGSPDVIIAGAEYESVIYAVAQGVEVINLSLGSEVPSQTGLSAMINAYNAGVVVVASAGNDNNSSTVYPAAFPNVISVAATTQIDTKASFSGFGSWIDISAPGNLIWSLAPTNDFTVKSGTSFSAPLVSATVGLMLSVNPDLTVDEVRNCLLSAADNIDIFNPDFIGQLGAGRLNVRNALNCVASSGSNFDVWLTDVLSPASSSCSNNFEQQIRVMNTGLDTVYSMNIRFQLDNNFAQTESWTGVLPPGETTVITLSELQAIVGDHSLRITILNSLNNTELDSYPADNEIIHPFEIVSSVGINLPFTESFESGSFNTNNWFNQNPDTDFGWEIANTTGTFPGGKSARLPYFIDFQSGSQDFLTSNTFNLSSYTNIQLSFEYAYQQRTQGLSDTLVVSISSDCGTNWVRVFEGWENNFNSFATKPLAGVFFQPGLASDWCTESTLNSCVDIDLSGFAGESGVRIRFEGYNSNGNNIYIDNINLSGELVEVPPIANFNANGNLSVCLGEEVQLANLSLNNPTEYKWSFPGAEIDSSVVFQPSIIYPDTGVYDIQLIATNILGSDTLLLNNYIIVLPLPEINATVVPDSVCRGEQALLQASGGIDYFWASSPGFPAIYTDSISVSPSNSTTYSVIGLSALGCTDTSSVRLTIIPPPATPTINNQDTILVASPAASYQWFVNGNEIEGANTILHVPLVNGNYNVRVYDSFGCNSISNPVNVNWVGINKIILSDLINAYPVPANGVLNISSTKTIDSYDIYDSTGKLVTSAHPKASDFGINTSSFANGIYDLLILSDSEYGTLKFMVSH